MLLRNAPIAPTLPAVDLARARKFYEHTLGLRVLRENAESGELWLEAGKDTTLLLYKRSATTCDSTSASFTVDDLDATMNELRSKGVKFEDYDLPNLKTVNGIASMDGERVAWFRDTEGNILAVGQIAA